MSLTLYTVGDVSFSEDRFADFGIEQTSLTLNDDHTGVFVMMGQERNIEWDETGRILFSGIQYCTMACTDANTIRVTLNDTQLTFTKGEAPAAQPTDASSLDAHEKGEPYGDSDGVIGQAKLLALYRWLSEMQDDFKYELTFDEIGEAAGKQGCDKGDGDGSSHVAYWSDGNNAFITVMFRNRGEKWTCSAISVSGVTDDWKRADVSGFPPIGSSAPAGTHQTEAVTYEIEAGVSGQKVAVTAQVPTENWYPTERNGGIRYCSAPNAEKAEESSCCILVEGKASLDGINSDLSKFENRKNLKPYTIGGVKMKGRAYRYIGVDWMEYYGEIAENVWISVRMSGVDFSAGTETEALVQSLTFEVR